MKKAYILPILILFVLAIGCSTSTKKNIGIGLLTVEDVLISTATAAKRMCEAGVVSDDDCLAMQRMFYRAETLLMESKTIWDRMVLIDSFVETSDYTNLIIEITKLTIDITIIVHKYRGGY